MLFPATSFAELKLLFTSHPLFLTGLLLLIGYTAGKLAVKLRLPEISGFIIAGLLVNAFTTGIVSTEMNHKLHMITEVAIGFLALTIGGEFSKRKLMRIGKDVIKITLVHLMGTFALVLVGCMIFDRFFAGFNIGYPYAILLAVIACATSPAIIVAEVHHMRAHGRFIDYLFGVVALSDAITVVLFGLAFTVVMNLLGAGGNFSLLGTSVREIFLSVFGGMICSIPMALVVRQLRNPSELLIITVGFVFVVTGTAIALHLSPLLVNMSMGAALVNYSGGNQRIFKAVEPFTPPIYAMFFIIAGLEINPSLFLSLPALSVTAVYMVLRAFGKIGSVSLGARLCGTDRSVARYLGLGMLSKGGVALGFVLLIQTSPGLGALAEDSVIYGNLSALVNVVLIAIFINELISPLLLRYAVSRGNDMGDV